MAQTTISGEKVEGAIAASAIAQITIAHRKAPRQRAKRTTRARATASRSPGDTAGMKRLSSAGPPRAMDIELTLTTVRTSAKTP